MKTMVKWFGILKWVGLLGLPIYISNHPIWKLFWYFWLFGALEFLFKLPIMIQSLQQLWAVVFIPIRYHPIPDKDTFHPKVNYSLPFRGKWVVVNGGVTKEMSHSWGIHPQRYAYDFLKLDQEGKSHTGDEKTLENYYCYGEEILAPAEGKVIKVSDKYEDAHIIGKGKVDPLAKNLSGNYVIIQHEEEEFSLLAHLQSGSILVQEGEWVDRFQVIGKCGNSGNTSEPHLHFQIQNTKSFIFSVGLPISFQDIRIEKTINYNLFDQRKGKAEVINSKEYQYIQRGDTVWNESYF
ncbi:MAG: M23 family metallopeptidase [Tissierellia bacterium]|nr:M23 family metallopeptidase [Tissierellia bacterium]